MSNARCIPLQSLRSIHSASERQARFQRLRARSHYNPDGTPLAEVPDPTVDARATVAFLNNPANGPRLEPANLWTMFRGTIAYMF